MTASKFILKDPDGAAYEVTLDDIQRYFKKGDIKPDWVARQDGQGAWHRVGVLLGLEQSTTLNPPGRPYEAPPPPPPLRPPWSTNPEPAPTVESTMAMFEAQPVVSPATVIHRLETIALPVKIVATLTGLGMGAVLGNLAGGRIGYLLTGAVFGGGVGFFAGYIVTLLLEATKQTLALQEKIAAKQKDS